MSDDYQVRKDIDRLQSTMYETGSDQLKLATKEELEAYQDEVDKRFYDVGQIDETVSKANKLIKDAEDKLSELTDDKVNVTDFESYQGQVTDALGGKSDKEHKHPISDVTSLQTTLDGKAPKNHRSTATTYGVSTDSYYGHSKASNSTPSADTVNGGSGTVNGIYANANHTHPRSGIYAQASHQHNASDVLYTIKDDLLWSLINTTIDKNLNGETLTGIYSVVNTKFNLSTAQSTSHTNNKYYIVYANTTTDVTTALSTGIDVSADIEDEYIKEMLDTKRNISDWVEATDVRVRVGTLQNDAQTMFNNILYWQSQHEDSGSGGSSSRVFYAQATWDTSTKTFISNSSSVPSNDWEIGDILILNCLAVGQGWLSKLLVGDENDYFTMNGYTHSAYLFPSNNSSLWTVVDKEPIVLLCMGEDTSNTYDFLWDVIHPSANANWDNVDWQVVDNLNSDNTSNVLSARQGKVLNTKIEQVSTITTITLNSYATLYVNEATHNCELHYERSFASATANFEYTWHSGIIDEKYRPPYKVFGFFIEPYGFLYVNTDGTISGKFPDGFSTRTATNGRVRWSY